MKKLVLVGVIIAGLGILVGCSNQTQASSPNNSEIVKESDTVNKEESNNAEVNKQDANKEQVNKEEVTNEDGDSSKVSNEDVDTTKEKTDSVSSNDTENDTKSESEVKKKPLLGLTENQVYQKFINTGSFEEALKLYDSFYEKYPHFWDDDEYESQLLIIDRAYDRTIDYFSSKY
ncbi:MAG: hypothetical protein ACRC41_04015 [Sarcina sp.]